MLHRREWGVGQPVIAMHPLGLDSSAFEGFGQVLARRGLRTIAVDLPGFGRSPVPDRPLTPAVMAEPVIELARSLPMPPLVLRAALISSAAGRRRGSTSLGDTGRAAHSGVTPDMASAYAVARGQPDQLGSGCCSPPSARGRT